MTKFEVSWKTSLLGRILQADLRGTILMHAGSSRQAYDMTYDCRSVFQHVSKIFLTYTSCRRPVVSLSHATKIVPCKSALISVYHLFMLFFLITYQCRVWNFKSRTTLDRVTRMTLKNTGNSRILELIWAEAINLLLTEVAKVDLHVDVTCMFAQPITIHALFQGLMNLSL